MRLAAIDLGTVTARLLIADVDTSNSKTIGGDKNADKTARSTRINRQDAASACADNSAGIHGGRRGRIHELKRHMRITHLGEGLQASGLIKSSAVAREVAACEDFLAAITALEKRDGCPVSKVVAVATSALRDAQNSGEVLDALARVGISVEVISGRREAQLSFLGALSGFGGDELLNEDAVLVIDVGGGSTELVLGVPADTGEPRVFSARSFDIGSRRATECFLKSDPPSLEELSCARAWIRAELAPYLEGLKPQPQVVIAVAGTATTAVSVRDAMVKYDPWRVHGSLVALSELNKMIKDLAKLKLEQRKRCVGLVPERASVIVGGLLVLQVALELVNINSFIASETDILHGLLLDAADSWRRENTPAL
jgi:exopolyphosphatase/guanosine-5'-triphosphate,3'-diphosphate pyrophosphatase